MSYKEAKVGYDLMDPFKILAQKLASSTSSNLSIPGLMPLDFSRGESCFLIDMVNFILGILEEGLGTKILDTEFIYKLTGELHFWKVAQDCFAMIVNDLITAGVSPVEVNMHLAVGDSDWFKDEKRYTDLLTGWKNACDIAKCVWGGGETPTLRNIIFPDNGVVLNGSAIGVLMKKDLLINPKNISAGNKIILFRSSGPHSNGLSWLRELVKLLPKGYLTPLGNGKMYYEELLEPTIIYSPIISKCIEMGIQINGAINITGHAGAKFMRPIKPFAYIIDNPFEPQAIFQCLQEYSKADIKEFYRTFNMGNGFALYVADEYVEQILLLAKELGFDAKIGGYIEDSQDKIVKIGSSVEFTEKDLQIR